MELLKEQLKEQLKGQLKEQLEQLKEQLEQLEQLERGNIKIDRKSDWCIYVNERGLYYINIMTGDMQQKLPSEVSSMDMRKLYTRSWSGFESLLLLPGWKEVLDAEIGIGAARRMAIEEGTAADVQSEIGAGAVGFVAFNDTEKAIHLLRDANKPGWLIIALDASSPYIDFDDKIRVERDRAKERRQEFFIEQSWIPDMQVMRDIKERWMRKTLWELLPKKSKAFVEEQEKNLSRAWFLLQKRLALAKGLHEYRDTIPQEIIDKIGEYI